MRLCSKCGKIKPLGAFAFKFKASAIRQSWCKDCHSAYTRTHYAENRQYYYDKNERKRLALTTMLQELKTETPCADCGQKFHFAAMDFDHLEDKLVDVSKMPSQGYGRTAILREIAKCEIVCSNCHRVRTYKRRHCPPGGMVDTLVLGTSASA